ncbi:MAG: exodeoxyribonuclease VII large subunit [Gammaproteobacteria bacterium]|nr:exodeoxyribonuclease VII large subunit [Gammaproteobacteria bacterium]
MQKTYTVSELSRALRNILESSFRSIRVEGELSEVSISHAGHCYLSLKEENYLIRCAWFRNRRGAYSIHPKVGMQVIVEGQVSLYPPRGDLQIIIHDMQVSGEGALRLAFEKLKRKLDAEGLFDPDRKQPMPEIPKSVGLITSPTGAVLHDMMITIKKRFPALRIILYPVAVQGERAPGEIVHMLETAGRRNEVEVIVVARGGGSAEDLQAFNDEQVARAIYKCPIPVISAVGHQVDVSITDFVADFSAPTPTGAAEQLTVTSSRLRERNQNLSRRLSDLARRYLEQKQQALDYQTARLARPDQRLKLWQQHHQHLTQKLTARMQSEIERHRSRLNDSVSTLRIRSPVSKVDLLRQKTEHFQSMLQQAILKKLAETVRMVEQLQGSIKILGPDTTLNRGYAIVLNEQGKVVTSPANVETGEDLELKVAKGQIRATAK